VTSIAGVQRTARRDSQEARAAWVCARAGLLPIDSLASVRAARASIRAYGGLGATITLAAARYGDRVALIDDLGRYGCAARPVRQRRACGWRAGERL